MSSFPDFSSYGYEVKQVLGQNHAGGRVTYQAINTKTQQLVVLKQFQFAHLASHWSAYAALHREVQILKLLHHPSIPRYIDSFETPTGFCLIQEYKPAPSLARSQHWTPTEIQQLAIAILEVLVYLQQRFLPVIHRDIKPENILVERQETLNVYLVDFGFAHAGTEEVAASSVVKGTLGFMPPEQIFNRELTLASDLYGLGATLVCLLTQTPSTQIGHLVDASYRFPINKLLPSLHPEFARWLQMMLEPNLEHRFSDATTALQALQSIELTGDVIKPKTLFRTTKLCSITVLAGFVLLALTLFGAITTIARNAKPRHDGVFHRHQKHEIDQDQSDRINKNVRPDNGDRHHKSDDKDDDDDDDD